METRNTGKKGLVHEYSDEAQTQDSEGKVLSCCEMYDKSDNGMGAHDFYFDGEIRQTSGWIIGIDITGVKSDISICHYDRVLLEKLAIHDIIVHLYKRYEDDVNLPM